MSSISHPNELRLKEIQDVDDHDANSDDKMMALISSTSDTGAADMKTVLGA